MIGFINRDCIERRLLFLSAKGYCSCLQKATVLVCKRLLFLSAKGYCSCLQKATVLVCKKLLFLSAKV